MPLDGEFELSQDFGEFGQDEKEGVPPVLARRASAAQRKPYHLQRIGREHGQSPWTAEARTSGGQKRQSEAPQPGAARLAHAKPLGRRTVQGGALREGVDRKST